MSVDPTSNEPLYQQVAGELRASITRGDVAPGERLGTHRELAARFGVSLITIKHALSRLADDGLIYGRVGKGTFVARSTPSSKPALPHHVIGMVLNDIKSPFFSLIVQAVEEKAYDAGYSLMLSTVGDRQGKEARQLEHFQSIGADGLVIASMHPEHHVTPTIRKVHDTGFPYVMVSFVDDPDVYFVGSDHEQGAYLATHHLIDQGRRRLAYLAAEQNNRLSQLRLRGFERAVREAGEVGDEPTIYLMSEEGEWNHFTSGYKIGQEIVQSEDRPDAVFAYNDLLAIGMMHALLDGGVSVPDDVAIVGFDDIARSQYAPVPLTTVRQPTNRIGANAVEMLLARIAGRETPRKKTLTPELVVRRSCGSTVQAVLTFSSG